MKRVGFSSLTLTLAGLALILISVVISLHDISLFFRSYLFSFLFWSDLPLGAMGLVMVYHLTGGAWAAVGRRILEALSGTVLLMAILSIPVLAGMKDIYPWLNATVAADPVIAHKHLYLNPATFILRTVVYFISWLVMDYYLRHWSESEEKDGSPLVRQKLRNLSGGGLVWIGFSVSFAAVDWQMSVEPKWYSTVYGMVFAVGEALTAYSVVLIVIGIAASKKKIADLLPKKICLDLGNILLVLVMIWAYLSFVQYLIIWSGNLPHEVTWFSHRVTKGWQWVGLLLLLFQFAAPFILLLFRSAKNSPKRLAQLGCLIFLIRIVDHYWMLVPGFDYKVFDLFAQSVLTWLGLGFLWLAVFFAMLSKKPIFAVKDPDWPITEAVLKGSTVEVPS